MSVVESSRSSLCGLTLDVLLRAEKNASHSNHTLLDVMREEHKQGTSGDKTTWKNFIDKLRLKRSVAAWASAGISLPFPDIAIHDSDVTVQDMIMPTPDSDRQRYNSLGFLLSNSTASTQEPPQLAPDLIDRQHDSADVSTPVLTTARSPLPLVPCHNPQSTHAMDDEFDESVAREGRICLGLALAEERALSAREPEVEASAPSEPLLPSPPEETQPARMSLMELLDDTDSQMGYFDANYTIDDSDDDAMVEKGEPPKGEFSCCVCMIRSKGAAFIPCGHTFCRRCSREIWVQRGSCPLCNSLILEILDIF